MSTLPYRPHFAANWRAEPTLRLCGYAAHGLWHELLDYAFDSESYGHVLLPGIGAPSAEQLATLAVARTSPLEVAALLRELEAAGVYSKTDAGVIYCRRMVREGPPARRPAAKPKPAKADATGDDVPLGALVDRLVRHWRTEVLAAHAELKRTDLVEPVGNARIPLRAIVREGGIEQAERDVSAYVRLDDAFLRECGWSLRWLQSRLPKLRAMAAEAKTTRFVDVDNAKAW